MSQSSQISKTKIPKPTPKKGCSVCYIDKKCDNSKHINVTKPLKSALKKPSDLSNLPVPIKKCRIESPKFEAIWECGKFHGNCNMLINLLNASSLIEQ